MPGGHHHRERDEIAQEILAYLTDHNDASDTLEGIIQWWLLEREIRYQADIVRVALAALVEKEFLVEHRENAAEPGSYRYEVNCAKQKEIKALLGN